MFLSQIGMNQDCSDLIAASGMTKTKNRPAQHDGHDQKIEEMPVWMQPVEHTGLNANELIMTSFKWNVHNHGRTMNLKWLAEIVHTNPAWMNPETAEKLGLKDGDWIELTSYFSQMLEEKMPNLKHGNRDATGRIVSGKMRVPIVTMPGIHPSAIAMSNSCGHWQYTDVAKGKKTPQETLVAAEGDRGYLAGSDAVTYQDPDWQRNMWWEDESGGDPAAWKQNTGNGWNQNQIMPIAPDPITGQQAFHSTVVSVTKVG